MTTITMRGRQVSAAQASATSQAELEDLGIRLAGHLSTAAADRGEGETISIEGHDDDVVELIADDGFVDVMTVTELRERTGARGTAETVEIPTVLSTGDYRDGEGAEIEEVRVHDLSALKEKVTELGVGVATDVGAELIAWVIEQEWWNSSKRPVGTGLHPLDSDSESFSFTAKPAPISAADDAYLLFIHGTFSNSTNGFGQLSGTKEWEILRERYSGRLLAFEHKTLGLSPLDNAIELVQALPEGARLDLVTHSRGGLVGDLLCLPPAIPSGTLDDFTRMRQTNQFQGQLTSYFKDSMHEFARSERDKLMNMVDALNARHLTVEHYARVACPGRGTTLASKNLDTTLKLFLNLLKLIPGFAGNPVYNFVSALLLGAAGKRTDPRTLPGLEAMMPTSPFIWLLSQLDARSDSLAVLAGDIQGKGIIGRMKTFVLDTFYGFQDHDIVVNTSAMDGGLRRLQAMASFQRGPEISHTRYFHSAVTRKRLENYLTTSVKDLVALPRGFNDHPSQDGAMKVDNVTREAGKAALPRLLLVGSQFGCILERGGHEQLWPDPRGLSRVGIRSAFEPDRAYKAKLSDTVYGKLGKVLPTRFEVIEAAQDIRVDLLARARALHRKIDRLAKTDRRPINILAHGDGGLVVLLAIARERKLSEDPRFGSIVLLGAPLHGSGRVNCWLRGDGSLVQQLAMLYPGVQPTDVGSALTDLPALLTLVVSDANHDQALVHAGNGRPPETQRTAAETRVVIRKILHEQRLAGMHHVVGDAAETLLASGELTRRGDGFMTQVEVGLLGGATGWVAPVDHFGLVQDERAIGAVLELLTDGTTNQLDAAPVEADLGGQKVESDVAPLFPSSSSLVQAAFGGRPPETAKAATLALDVTHGSLHNLKVPVAVGHYDGTELAGAERFLDARLDGALSDHLYYGFYPLTAGKAVVIDNPGSQPPAAAVLSLGNVGELSESVLTMAMTEAALRCATWKASQPPVKGKEEDAPVVVTIASLLVGTVGSHGISVRNSVKALVSGVIQANAILRDREQASKRRLRIDRLQFIELHADVAEEAARVVRDIERELGEDVGDNTQLAPASYLVEGEGGRPGRPDLSYEEGIWKPLIVQAPIGAEVDDDQPPRWLNFVMLNALARADETENRIDVSKVVQLIREGVTRPDFGPRNHTLYQLLLPNELKEHVENATNLTMVLDDYSAQFPWELLASRNRRDELKPLSVKKGLLRRLKRPPSKTRQTGPMKNQAMIIGDPAPGGAYAPLEGARREAEAVELQLAERGFDINAFIRRPGQPDLRWRTVVDGLFEKDYRIIHAATHGNYDPDEWQKSGIVIGPDQYLTANDIGCKSVPPELVFLNCCHLGMIRPWVGASGAEGRLARTRSQLNVLASSIAVKLIDMGVRAVIAAGWAVNDRAAITFANAFYDGMFEGRAFGNAVQRARVAAWSHSGRTNNTWAAYQCYGDPGFRLNLETPARIAPPPPVAPSELKRRIRHIHEDASERRGVALEQSTNELEILRHQAPPQWMNAEMFAEFGHAYGQLKNFRLAIAAYKQAIECDEDTLPFSVYLQIVNLSVRLAAETFHGGARERKRSPAEIDRLFEDAAPHVKMVEALPPTPERSGIVGSFYKRQALTLTNGADRLVAIENSRDAYGRSTGGAGKPIDQYCALNHINMAVLTWGYDGGEPASSSEERQQLIALLQECEQVADRKARAGGNFWDRVGPADVQLSTVLLYERLGQQQALDEVVAAYQRPLSELHRSSTRERDSVLSNLRDLSALASDEKVTKGLEAIRSTLEADYDDRTVSPAR